MSEVLIKYQSKSFWISPDFIERVSEYICQVYESNGLNTYSQNLMSIYYCCNGNRTGESIGSVNILFNEITSNTDKSAIIAVLNQAKVLVQSLGTLVSVAQLNQFENAKSDLVYMTEWSIPIQTSSLVNLLNLFIDLLDGTYPNNLGNVNFVGYQNIPNPNVQVI